MFKWLKRKNILAKNSLEDDMDERQGPRCMCGSYDINTGQTYKANMIDGQLVFTENKETVKGIMDSQEWVKELNKVAVKHKHICWCDPVFVGIITIHWNVYSHGLFKATTIHSQQEKVSLYRRTNFIDNVSEYYYNREGLQRRIDSDAFEKCNQVILLDEN